MWASPFSTALLNLCGALPEYSPTYMTREEAHEWLKQYTNEDFGHDALAWEQWGREHNRFYPGWPGISSVLDE